MRQRRRDLITSATSLREAKGVAAAVIFAAIQGGALYLAALADSARWLPGESTGLLEHPGMMSIVLANALLPIVASHAKSMTCKLGQKFPSSNPALVKRYYKLAVLKHAFGKEVFWLFFVLSSIAGFCYLVNQTVVLRNPNEYTDYYGHDTFDTATHVWSFYVSRPVLFISWVIVIPWFAATLLAHVVAVSTLLARAKREGWASFYVPHPDRCGGYSVFGWADVWYAIGIAIVLVETVLIIMTHHKATVGNGIAIVGITVGALVISLFSAIPALKTVWRQRTLLNSKSVLRLRHGGQLDQESCVVLFNVRFIPYTETAVRLAVGTRILITATYGLSSWALS
jgi:hypothetical protein